MALDTRDIEGMVAPTPVLVPSPAAGRPAMPVEHATARHSRTPADDERRR
jgi:hypothetical protein